MSQLASYCKLRHPMTFQVGREDSDRSFSHYSTLTDFPTSSNTVLGYQQIDEEPVVQTVPSSKVIFNSRTLAGIVTLEFLRNANCFINSHTLSHAF